MAALAVLHLHHPQIRIIAHLSLYIGVQLAFLVAGDRLDPQTLAVGAEGFGVDPRLAFG